MCSEVHRRALRLPGVVILGLAAVLWSHPPTSAGGAEPDAAVANTKAVEIDWSSAVAMVPAALLKRDLLGWSDELAAKLNEADAEGLIVSLEVFLRSGQPERISMVIPRLGKQPAVRPPGGYVAERLVRLGYYQQARLWFDTYPADGAADAMAAFVKWLAEKESAAAAENYLRDKARRDLDRGFYRCGNWPGLYWRRLQAGGKLEAHLADLAEQVRRAPAEAGPVFEYLGARACLPNDQRPAADWLAGVCRLERALDNYSLGGEFAGNERFESAIGFYDRSLACPVAEYDRTWFNQASMCSMYVPPEQVEKVLRQWTKGALASACFRAQKLPRAQKLVEELTGKKDGTVEDLGPFLFAGQVQAASGQRVVEGRILKAEEEKKDSARYWLNRAQYYLGRKELEPAEQAYQAAMKLPPDGQRFEVVRDYGWFLAGRDRHREAERLFRAEIERVGLQEADFWLNQLENLDGKGGVRVAWDEPLVWDWLAKRKATHFGQAEQWRLEKTARKAAEAPGAWPAFEKQARALAADPCPPALQYCLGLILHGRGQTQEGTRLMAAAYDRWPKDAWPPAGNVGDGLMRLMLAQGDVKGAEKIVAGLLDDPARGGDPGWLGEVAVAAARAKAVDLAVRLWQRKMALDLTDQKGLDELAAAGLGEQLRELYSALTKRAPGNQAVAAALQKLERR